VEGLEADAATTDTAPGRGRAVTAAAPFPLVTDAALRDDDETGDSGATLDVVIPRSVAARAALLAWASITSTWESWDLREGEQGGDTGLPETGRGGLRA
jgi:hypothetical protein